MKESNYSFFFFFFAAGALLLFNTDGGFSLPQKSVQTFKLFAARLKLLELRRLFPELGVQAIVSHGLRQTGVTNQELSY